MTATALDRPEAAAAEGTLALGTATLVVRDLDLVSRFYAEELGFPLLSSDRAEATLGAGARPLLHLRADPAARAPARGGAGLFHLAWRLPSRVDLARFALRACANGVSLSGSDHLVSEALYLADPEGNGIEVYVDRPRDEWGWDDGAVRMATRRIDLRALAAAAGGECAGIPEGADLGHVHLKVGAIPPARDFWIEALGLRPTARYGEEAAFLAGLDQSGQRYHHHVAVNTWHSQGAGRRAAGESGLDHFQVLSAALAPGERIDPWGNRAIVVAPTPG